MLTGIIVLVIAAVVGIAGSLVSVARDGFRAIPTKTYNRWSLSTSRWLVRLPPERAVAACAAPVLGCGTSTSPPPGGTP
jgi:hypothetical protein